MTTAVASPESPQIPWWVVLIEGIAALIIGFLLITSTARTVLFLVQFLGFYWIFSGIFQIIGIFVNRTMWGWRLFSGILSIIAGGLIVQYTLLSAVLVPTTLAIVIAIQGIIIGAIGLFQAFKGAGWGAGILGVLSIIFGFLILGSSFQHPLATALTIGWVGGIFAIVGGIMAIVMAFRLRSA